MFCSVLGIFGAGAHKTNPSKPFGWQATEESEVSFAIATASGHSGHLLRTISQRPADTSRRLANFIHFPELKVDPFNLLLNWYASKHAQLEPSKAPSRMMAAQSSSEFLSWPYSHTAAVEVARKVAAESCNPDSSPSFQSLAENHISLVRLVAVCYQSFLGLVAEGGTFLPRWHGFSLQDHGEGAKASAKQGPSHGRAHRSGTRNCLKAMQQGMWSESAYRTAVMGGYCPPAWGHCLLQRMQTFDMLHHCRCIVAPAAW